VSWDAIVVAGARVDADGTPSAALVRRVELAVRLFHAGEAPTIAFTGGGSPSEAAVGGALARSLGVPERALVLEDRSASTEQNARFTAELLGPARVVVVTDDYHAWRCERVFRRYFAEVRVVPTSGPRARWGLRAREAAVIAVYAARGWLRSPPRA
jgi:uncharacterized SAM-binding protein YcdF (DUF218 family)